MGRNAKACAECAQKCQLIHGNKISSSPPVPSFFKVMIGDRYSEVLFLPPEFGPKVSRLIGQNVLLEDSSGQRWEVTVSNLSGSFAFQQGWNEFSLHHGLDFGDFVVFHYIIGSHFVVKIYTKTGCEKLDFPDRNQRKRSRTSRNYTFRDGHCYPTDKGSMNKQSSSSSVTFVSDEHISQSQREENDLEKAITKFISDGDNRKERPQLQLKTEYLEEPYYLINRDLRDIQGEDRRPIFDLSCFEMLGNNCGADQGSKIPNGDEKHPSCSDVSFKSKIEDVFVQNDVVDKMVVDRVVASEATDFDIMEKNNDFQKMDKKETVCENFSCNTKISEHLVSTIFVEPKKNAGNSSHRSKRLFKRFRIAEEGSKAQSKSQLEIGQIIVSQKDHTPLGNSNQSGKFYFAGNFKESNIPYSTRSQNWQPGKLSQVVKVDNGQSSDAIVKENAIQLLKTETLDLVPFSSPLAMSISCEVASVNQPFLELPTCLPTPLMSKIEKEGKVVVLRDPATRLWPVLYQEICEFNILSGGWENFCKANNIKAGDECVFKLENWDEGIYGVNIFRK